MAPKSSRTLLRPSAVFLSCLFCIFLTSCEKKQPSNTLSGQAMGTTWTLAWRGQSKPGVEKAVTETLLKWDKVLSQWKPDSDLSRANSGEPRSSDLERVIVLADEIHKASAGAFDYHLLKETHDAGFGPDETDPPGNAIDLSAIGKGYAVDRVGEKLRTLGITDFVFELGGEVLAGEGEWEVEIESPDPASQATLRTVTLKNQGLATSGNYRQFEPDQAGLISHIIDPKTRKPIIRQPISVSVTAKDCATADAWATALFVLGPAVPSPPSINATWNKP